MNRCGFDAFFARKFARADRSQLVAPQALPRSRCTLSTLNEIELAKGGHQRRRVYVPPHSLHVRLVFIPAGVPGLGNGLVDLRGAAHA